MPKKRDTQVKHARRRFWERYGMRVQESDLNYMKNLIKTGKSTPVETQSLRVSVHDLEFREEMCRVVYDKMREVVVTVLPREVLDADLQSQVPELSPVGRDADHPPGCRLPDTF